jgi:hypothetical protein
MLWRELLFEPLAVLVGTGWSECVEIFELPAPPALAPEPQATSASDRMSRVSAIQRSNALRRAFVQVITFSILSSVSSYVITTIWAWMYDGIERGGTGATAGTSS